MVEEFGTYDMGRRLGDADRTTRNVMQAAAKWESRNQKADVKQLEGMLAEFRQMFALYDEAKGANNMAAAQAYLAAATDIANRSIAKAMQIYGIDPQRAKSIRFDENLDARGKTSFDGKTITIGAAAFENEGRLAAGRFAATIYHETVHSVLSPMNGVTREEYASDPAGHERPVYGVELSPANVKRFGLTEDDVAAIRRGFEKYYGEPL